MGVYKAHLKGHSIRIFIMIHKIMENKFLIRTLLCLKSIRVSTIPMNSRSIYLRALKRVVLDEIPTSYVYCSRCNNILKFHQKSWTTLIRHFNKHVSDSSVDKIQKSEKECHYKNPTSKAEHFKDMGPVQHSRNNLHPVDKILKTKYVRGKNVYFVHWLNKPMKFNSWVKEEDITRI